MAKTWAKDFYNNKSWHRARQQYINSVDGLCERCLAKGIYKPGWIVHHKIWLTEDNINDVNISLNPNNFEYLCQDCHNKENFGQAKVIDDELMFDLNGNIIKK